MGNNQESLDGQEAQRIVESDVYKKALQTLSDGYMSQWLNSTDNDVAGRERTYTKLQILSEFATEIKTVLETGQMADEQIKRRHEGSQEEAPSVEIAEEDHGVEIAPQRTHRDSRADDHDVVVDGLDLSGGAHDQVFQSVQMPMDTMRT